MEWKREKRYELFLWDRCLQLEHIFYEERYHDKTRCYTRKKIRYENKKEKLKEKKCTVKDNIKIILQETWLNKMNKYLTIQSYDETTDVIKEFSQSIKIEWEKIKY